MQHRRSARRCWPCPSSARSSLAACGDDDEDATTATDATEAPRPPREPAGTEPAATEPAATEPPAPRPAGTRAADTDRSGGRRRVPRRRLPGRSSSIQTDWNPEAEHGWIYEMVGDDYTIDKDGVSVTGPLVASGGVDTGVEIEIRSGGPAIGFQTVTSQLYTDDDILLGYVYTDEGIQNSAEFPTVAVMAGMEKNPQMIMWDPATYPDVETIADIGEAGILVRYFGGAAYMDYFTQTGHPVARPGRRLYDGTPALLRRRPGQRRPSRASARPSRTSTRTRSPTGASRSPTPTSTTPAGRTTPSRSRSRPDELEDVPRLLRRSSCRSSSSRRSTTSTTRPRPTR